MATIPFQNFAFTDPVAAQQAVQMGQLMALAQAERDRNFANFSQEELRSRRAQQAARENAARQQAITDGQIRSQMAEAERARQARATETDKVLASQEKVAGLGLEKSKATSTSNRQFKSVAALVSSDDPPTDSEFDQLVSGLDEDSVLQLRSALMQSRRALTELAQEAKRLANFWNPRFKVIPGSAAHTAAKAALANDRAAQDLIIQDPVTMEFVPKYKGPRMDAPGGGVTPIEELRSRLGVRPLSNTTVTTVPSPGFTPQPTDFAVPVVPPATQPAPIVVPRMLPLGY